MNIINYKALIGLVILLCLIGKPNYTMSQNTDMQRDLTVIEAVISEIVNSEFRENNRLTNKKAQASYVDGRGVLATVPIFNTHIFGVGERNVVEIKTDSGKEGNVFVRSSAPSLSKEEQQEKEEAMLLKLERVARTFLVNYGDLARELPENEKIILLFKKQQRTAYRIFTENTLSIGADQDSNSDESIIQFSAEVLKSDVTKLKAAKLTEDEFWERVVLKKVRANNTSKDRLEFNVLAKIFEGKLSEQQEAVSEEVDDVIIVGLGNRDRVDYELVSGLGVVYNLKLNMPFTAPNIFIKGLNLDKGEEEKEKTREQQSDRDEQLEDMAKELVENIKEDMIAYGRTLRSLSQDEMLIVEINLPRCYECELPATYQLSVNKEVLEKYEKRKIALEAAIDQIVIKEKGKAKDTRNYRNFYFDWRE